MPNAALRFPGRRRWIAIALGVFTLLVSPLIGAVPAQAAGIVQFDALPEVTEPSLSYGAVSPAARRIVIGPDTTTVLLTHGLTPVRGAPVWCGSPQGVIAPSEWNAEDWDPTAPHPVAVIGPIVPGSVYTYHCHQDDSNEVYFTLVAEAGAPDIAAVTAGPETLVRRDITLNHTREGFDTKTVVPGDIVRVTGPAGTWGTPAEGAVPTIEVTCGLSYKAGAHDISFTPNGSTVQLTLPVDVDQTCFNDVGQSHSLSVSTLITTPGTATTPTVTEKVVWSGGLDFDGNIQALSTTSLRLDRPVNLSVLPTKALITVRTSVLPADAGRVDIYVDGHPVGGLAVPPAKSSTVQFVLPKQDRGYHTVVAVFRENAFVLGSRSSVVKLRILR